jgi:prolyl 4-hydroxylase
VFDTDLHAARLIGLKSAELSGLPSENGEVLQIQKYEVGGRFDAHSDYFDPSNPGSQSHLQRGGQRVATIIYYLNDVEEGGSTVFPNLGIRVRPERGAALYFHNCDPVNHNPIINSLHGGEPVTAGVKWIVTKWIRESRHA